MLNSSVASAYNKVHLYGKAFCFYSYPHAQKYLGIKKAALSKEKKEYKCFIIK
jgi:hypothetical protein